MNIFMVILPVFSRITAPSSLQTERKVFASAKALETRFVDVKRNKICGCQMPKRNELGIRSGCLPMTSRLLFSKETSAGLARNSAMMNTIHLAGCKMD